ncbi:MAG: mevalonate kinase [Candidatus Bipolaricaulota bacterium]|nr:hypothetical protein [Candidatus Bipolaricaulota bacterium]
MMDRGEGRSAATGIGTGRGYGKTILIGDMFVYLGIPAIVSAIPQSTVAVVREGREQGWTLLDNRPEVPGYKEAKRDQQVRSISDILSWLGLSARPGLRLEIELGGDLVAGSGVGASAASCVAIVRALNERFSLGLTDDEVNHAAWRGEFAYHNKPSGIDNTASCFGGVLVFRQDPSTGSNDIERLRLAQPVEAVLVNSGVTVDTAGKRAHIAAFERREPAKFASYLDLISAQAGAMREALVRGDLRAVGRIMNDNHRLLIDMDLSHPEIVRMAERAVAAGAWGAKVTGGGRGGYMLALTPGTELQGRVASRFGREGYITMNTVIGAV